MQLTTQHETIDDEEIRHNSREPMKIKYGHRYRRKKIIRADSEDTVLEFDENEDTKARLPESVQDNDLENNSFFTNVATDPSNYHCETNKPTSKSTSTAEEKCDSSYIEDGKKRSLLNDIILTSKHSQSANNSPDVRITRKKFSLPCDILKDHDANDRYIPDTNTYRKKYNSSANLPSDIYKSDESSADGCLRKQYYSTDGIEGRCKLDSKVGEFVQEVMFSISEIGHGNPGGVRKLKGIIKKTLSYEKDDPNSNVIRIKRREKCKNTVHFSEENITIEIPRPSQPYFRKVKDKMSYYCCFGFLFPST